MTTDEITGQDKAGSQEGTRNARSLDRRERVQESNSTVRDIIYYFTLNYRPYRIMEAFKNDSLIVLLS